jgi:hypothetical protein
MPESTPLPPPARNLVRYALGFAALVPLLLAWVGWFFSPPILNPDSASGFAVWESGQAGAPWNHLRFPDPANLSKDRDTFLTWWSPGQYVVPGWFKRAGFSWGQAMLLTTLACVWIQTAGCWWLARSVGLDTAASAWFTVVATVQWHTLQQFGHFRGGEVLIEAATPWLFGCAWRLRERPQATLLAAPVIVVVALWLKLSALVLLVPLLGALFLWHSWPDRRRPWARVPWLLGFGMAMMLTGIGLHMAFFRLGPTPAAAPPMVDYPIGLASFAALSPWLAATGLGSLVGRICWWFGQDSEAIWRTFALPSSVIGVAAWWWGWRNWLRPLASPLRYAVMWMLTGNVALMAFLYVRGSTISVEDRHLRPVATLIILAAAYAAATATPVLRRVTQIAMLLIAAYGLGAAAQRSVALARLDSRGAADFCQQQFSSAAQSHFRQLTAPLAPRTAVIYFPSAEIAFEDSRQRRIISDDLTRDTRSMRQHRWQGRVPYVLAMIQR